MKRILNYPGSKWNLAEKTVDLFPEHVTYIEPFFGSGAMFFTKAPSKIETINDLDQRVVNFFRVCREQPIKLAEAIYMTPVSRWEQRESLEIHPDPLEDARRFLVLSWQSIGGIQRPLINSLAEMALMNGRKKNEHQTPQSNKTKRTRTECTEGEV